MHKRPHLKKSKHILILLSLILSLTGLTNSKISINKDTRQFQDEEGRTVVFHGVNVVYKLPPYTPVTESFDPFYSLSQEDVRLMKGFGFNLVRLGVIWESVERSPGVYDLDYLHKMEEIVNMLGEAGIYTLIDAHQDMFSRLFCGEGVPAFYAKELYHETECKSNLLSRLLRMVGACIPLKTFHWRYDEEGLPLIEDCRVGFLKFHQSPELTTIYNSFYQNENNIQDKFASFWKTVAAKFKDNPYVIGYDLWNEPWPGDLWSDLRSMWPGHADHSQVLPFFRKLDKEIRSVHPDYISFFEPVPFPDTMPLFGGQVLGGLTETPAGKDYLDKQVLNLHSYCCQARADACAYGEPSLADAKDLCTKFHKSKMKSNVKNAKSLGVPYIVTEFGACSNSEACYYEMKGFVEAAEENLVSWTYWMYKPYGDHTTTASEHTEGMFLDTGLPQQFKVKALTRTYIQSYQGEPLKSHFNNDTFDYFGQFIYNPLINAPTVVYANTDEFYTNGYDVVVTDADGRPVHIEGGDTYYTNGQPNYYSFKIKPGNAPANSIININVVKK